eukprot:scaffold824_cov132-Chaetoceros_neogracile.AAC.19
MEYELSMTYFALLQQFQFYVQPHRSRISTPLLARKFIELCRQGLFKPKTNLLDLDFRLQGSSGIYQRQ